MAETTMVSNRWFEPPQTANLILECEDFIAALLERKAKFTTAYLVYYDNDRIRLCFASESYGKKPDHLDFFRELNETYEKMQSKFYLLSFEIISVVPLSDPIAIEAKTISDSLGNHVNVSRHSISGFGIELLVLFPMNVFKRVGAR